MESRGCLPVASWFFLPLLEDLAGLGGALLTTSPSPPLAWPQIDTAASAGGPVLQPSTAVCPLLLWCASQSLACLTASLSIPGAAN